MPFKWIRSIDIEKSLEGRTRQYLLGTLALPQALAHIDDPDLEIGISSYVGAAMEPAHKHARAKEYQLVLSGMTEYRDLGTGEIHVFKCGDFYAIFPGTAYLQRIKRDTRILFVNLTS